MMTYITFCEAGRKCCHNVSTMNGTILAEKTTE